MRSGITVLFRDEQSQVQTSHWRAHCNTQCQTEKLKNQQHPWVNDASYLILISSTRNTSPVSSISYYPGELKYTPSKCFSFYIHYSIYHIHSGHSLFRSRLTYTQVSWKRPEMEILSCLVVKLASSQKKQPKPKLVYSNHRGLSQRDKLGQLDLRGAAEREIVTNSETSWEKTARPCWKPRLPRW